MSENKLDNREIQVQPGAENHLIKGKVKWLTFEYALAMGSLVVSTLLSVWVVSSLFRAWSGQSSTSVNVGRNWFAGVFDLSVQTAGTGLVVASVAAVILGVVALVCFSRVSRAITQREGYTRRVSYKTVTYGGFAVLTVQAVALIAKLIGVLVSSLLFIGVKGAASIYKSMYLAEFIPYLISLMLVVVVAIFIGKIISGKNKSKLISTIVVAVAAAVMIATCITVAIQARDTSSERSIDVGIGSTSLDPNPERSNGMPNQGGGGINLKDIFKDMDIEDSKSPLYQDRESGPVGIPR